MKSKNMALVFSLEVVVAVYRTEKGGDDEFRVLNRRERTWEINKYGK